MLLSLFGSIPRYADHGRGTTIPTAQYADISLRQQDTPIIPNQLHLQHPWPRCIPGEIVGNPLHLRENPLTDATASSGSPPLPLWFSFLRSIAQHILRRRADVGNAKVHIHDPDEIRTTIGSYAVGPMPLTGRTGQGLWFHSFKIAPAYFLCQTGVAFIDHLLCFLNAARPGLPHSSGSHQHQFSKSGCPGVRLSLTDKRQGGNLSFYNQSIKPFPKHSDLLMNISQGCQRPRSLDHRKEGA